MPERLAAAGVDIPNYNKGKKRLLMTKNNQQYDITDFISLHPGGAEILYKHRNEDLGRLMTASENGFHRHSQAAFRILENYRINNDYLNENDQSMCKRNNSTEQIQNTVLVDWNKPMLEQVDQLGDKYFDWVHEPEEHHIRLFHSDFCEFFSMAPWWLVPVIWIPVMCLGMYQAYQNISVHTEILGFPFLQEGIEIKSHHLLLLYIAGLFQWTLLEYLIHRWLFHLRPVINSPFFIRMHFILHGQHHKAPLDKTRLVFPPVPASVFAFCIYNMLLLIYPVAVAQSLFSGTVMGYLIYDLIHYYLHHGSPVGAYFKELKHYHMLHHYVHQHNGFGISSKFWDYPFGTLISTKDNQ
ncbi:fatty acid 2-hydroxylase-like [Octopus vulgaris]|uniref:Fatty acid 2-hydroxylase n=2 Tax=Octopus TaxID=6643 RepID=A0AA36AQ06_OCTVU|nr:fatty acid 2-hydroxylase-like [Octopus vulgaris]